MKINRVKEKMLAGKTAAGAVCALGSPLAVEILSVAGFDYILMDNQHSAWQQENTMAAIRACNMGNATPLVRVRKNDFWQIGNVLDMGAMGIVVPMVNNREEALRVVEAAYYPPKGRRSMGAFGTAHLGSDYLESANENLLITVQIESQEALEKAEEILSVEGIDGCWVGPSDLAASMGLDLSTPEGLKRQDEAVYKILDACRSTGKIAGTAGDAARWIPEGFIFATATIDTGLLAGSGRKILKDLAGLQPAD